MTLYKESHEPGASKEDSLAAFKILRNYITVQILTSINDKDLRCQRGQQTSTPEKPPLEQ
ncbi:hypothetical protein VP01_4219g3 [Puccinia sorghi]|uniref:Uncharacterized protein n=1 Tax=Puccinia sorghi TaxID=27349 RepID=A0A0L6URI9_9BASI|nr:hypothetical protein VP01_4219g3 [Puccinia sorghi]